MSLFDYSKMDYKEILKIHIALVRAKDEKKIDDNKALEIELSAIEQEIKRRGKE